MSDQMINDAVALVAALQALKLKRGVRIRGTHEGTEIRAPGKPMLLLTNDAVREFAREIEEASQ